MVLKLSRALSLSPAVVFALTLAAAQEPTPIKVQVKEVIVPVSVTTQQGQFVTELVESDFSIYDQGKLQTITHFSAEPNQPVVVGFLLDLSSSSRTQWKNIRDAAIELVFTLVPGDKTHAGYLIGYGNEAELLVDTTFDPEKIVEKIRKLSPSGGSAMNDAIYMASGSSNRKVLLNEPYDPRRVIVVIGNGDDNASTHTLEQALELAQRQMVTIYTIDTSAYGFANDTKKNLKVLAENTGGRLEEPLQNVYRDVPGFLPQPSDLGNNQLKEGAYTAQMQNALNKAIADIAGEITTQYTLHYVPEVGDDPHEKRTIEVKVKGLSSFVVRARNYYYPYPVIP
jgi:Ca-activated chloride channel homolog